MADVEHLRNAPITEALLDFRCVLAQGDHSKTFLDLARQVSPEYPILQERRAVSLAFTITPAATPSASAAGDATLQGVVCVSSNGKDIVQFRADGFSYHRLSPYESWAAALPRALKGWKLYSAALKPTLVQIAVRNINQIIVPDDVNASDYLTNAPSAPLNEGAALTGFYSRVTLHDPALQVSAGIVQSSQPSLRQEPSFLVVLDIEVVKASPTGLPETAIDGALADLHDYKNRLFFDSLTKRALEPYR